MRTTHEQFTVYDEVFHARDVSTRSRNARVTLIFNGSVVINDERIGQSVQLEEMMPVRASYIEDELGFVYWLITTSKRLFSKYQWIWS